MKWKRKEDGEHIAQGRRNRVWFIFEDKEGGRFLLRLQRGDQVDRRGVLTFFSVSKAKLFAKRFEKKAILHAKGDNS